MIRLLLVDEHAVLRHGLRALFQQEFTLEVLDGLATTQRLRAEFPNVRIPMASVKSLVQKLNELLPTAASTL